jgi:hypothetical protein
MNRRAPAEWVVSGLVEAPVEEVSSKLLALRPGRIGGDNGLVLATEGPEGRGPMKVAGGPRRFTATVGEPPGTSLDVEVDPAQRRLTVQGHFWYRGTYTVDPHARGSRLTYRVDNIAPGAVHWLIPLWQFRLRAQMTSRLGRLLRTLGDCLGCAVYPIAD